MVMLAIELIMPFEVWIVQQLTKHLNLHFVNLSKLS